MQQEAKTTGAVEVQTPPDGTSKPKKVKKANPKKRKKLIIWSAVILVVAGYFGFNMYKTATYIPMVKAGEVTYQSIQSYLSTTAVISSSDSSAYFAPPNSKALAVNFKVGDKVKAGETIATYDLTDLQKQIELAQISYNDAKLAKANAELNLENTKIAYDDVINGEENRSKEIEDLTTEIRQYNNRIKDITNESGVPSVGDGNYSIYSRLQQRLIAAEAERDQLDAQTTKDADITKAKNAQSNATNGITSATNAMSSAAINLASLQKYQKDEGIVADFDGIITEMNLVEGGSAPAGATACVVQTTDNLKATFNIGKYDVGTIKVGQTAKLTLGSLEYDGVITKIGAAAVKVVSSSGTTSSAQVPAEITISDPDTNLVIGLDFDVDIETSSNDHALALPVEAVLSDRDGDFCYRLLESEKAGVFTYEKAYVQTGNSSDAYVEVLGGLNENDRVVLNPPTTIEMMKIVKLEPTAAPVAVSASSSTASAA